MAEKNLIINNRELKYNGIFRVDELVSVINRSLEEKGYSKSEKKTEELVTEEGRRTYLELRPKKVKTNYVTLIIKIKISLDKLTEVFEEIDGVKRRYENGEINIVFDSWIISDYESRWGMKPWVFFLKGVINKFLYTFPLEAEFPGELAGDTAYVYVQIKKLLNSYRYEKAKTVSEEEIRKQIEEDIRKEALLVKKGVGDFSDENRSKEVNDIESGDVKEGNN